MNTFKCDMCGGVFEKGQSEEEALAEYKQHFGIDMRPEEVGLCCDDCWEKIHPDKYPREVERAVDETIKARLDGWHRRMFG